MSHGIDSATLQAARQEFSAGEKGGYQRRPPMASLIPASSSCPKYDAAMAAHRAVVAAFVALIAENPEQAVDFIESTEGVVRTLGLFHGLKLPACVRAPE